MGYKYQMSNVKVQMKSKNQMKKFIKERILDIESFWHSFEIWTLTFEIVLPSYLSIQV